MLETLPAYLAAREQGLFLNVAQLPSSPTFFDFVEQLFNNGQRFAELNYPLFLDAIYFPENLNKFTTVQKLARAIVPFHGGRQALYKTVRVLEDGAIAEYLFESAVLEVEYDQPIYGPQDENGECAVIGIEKRIRTQPTMRDLDEFIAAMWIRSVRYGLLLPVISAAIAKNKTDRLVIARRLCASLGKNANVVEVFDGLQQNNAPAIVDGRINLKRFQNRYPQVPKDCVMLRKTPMQQGTVGITVKGERIEPAHPEDFDLSTLCGEGTRLEARAEGLVLISNLKGFIFKEKDLPLIHVVETIETTEVIDAKNTGDLDLSVDAFIAHGEVQEGRNIKGKNMRFNAPVYGNLESIEGVIDLNDNVGGAKILLQGKGAINASKRVYNSRVDAVHGSVVLNYAENTTIVAQAVEINEAVNCTIIADRVELKASVACHIAAKAINIITSKDRRGSPTQVIVLLPDIRLIDLEKRKQQTVIDNGMVFVKERTEQLAKIKDEPDFSKYLAIRQSIQAGHIKLTPELQDRLHKLQRIHSGTFKTIERLIAEIKQGREVTTRKASELKMYSEAEEAKASNHKCFITQIEGETSVHAKTTYINLAEFSTKPANTLLTWLQTLKIEDKIILTAESGELAWQFSLS